MEDDWMDELLATKESGAIVPENFNKIIAAQADYLDPSDIDALSVEDASRMDRSLPTMIEIYTSFIAILDSCGIEYVKIDTIEEYEEYNSTIVRPANQPKEQPVAPVATIDYSVRSCREILSYLIDNSSVDILMELEDNYGRKLFSQGSEELAYEVIAEIMRKEHASRTLFESLGMDKEEIEQRVRELKVKVLSEVAQILRRPEGFEDWSEAIISLPSLEWLRKEADIELKELRNKIGVKMSGKPCIKCKSTDTFVIEKQTRSGDEGATLFYTCQSCNKNWKENA